MTKSICLIILFSIAIVGCEDYEYSNFKKQKELEQKEQEFYRNNFHNYDICEFDPLNEVCI